MPLITYELIDFPTKIDKVTKSFRPSWCVLDSRLITKYLYFQKRIHGHPTLGWVSFGVVRRYQAITAGQRKLPGVQSECWSLVALRQWQRNIVEIYNRLLLVRALDLLHK